MFIGSSVQPTFSKIILIQQAPLEGESPFCWGYWLSHETAAGAMTQRRNAPGCAWPLQFPSYPERRCFARGKQKRPPDIARMGKPGKCWCHGLHGPEAQRPRAYGQCWCSWPSTMVDDLHCIYIYMAHKIHLSIPIRTLGIKYVYLHLPFKFISIYIYSWKIKMDHGQNTLQEAWIGSGNITMPAKNESTKATKVPIQGLQSLPSWNNHIFWLLQVYTPTEVIIGHISIILPRLSCLYRQYISPH